MHHWAWAFLLAAGLPAAAIAQCCPEPMARRLAIQAEPWSAPSEALALLEDGVRFAHVYESLRRKVEDLQPDHLACLAASASQPLLGDVRQVAAIVEGYRNIEYPAFASMVLMGVFRHVPEGALGETMRRYHERVCRSRTPAEFDLRVAGDALVSMSEAHRERFLQKVLQLYGPGSSVHYKTEANDCLFLADRTLAEAALSTLPEEKRREYEPRLAAFYQ